MLDVKSIERVIAGTGSDGFSAMSALLGEIHAQTGKRERDMTPPDLKDRMRQVFEQFCQNSPIHNLYKDPMANFDHWWANVFNGRCYRSFGRVNDRADWSGDYGSAGINTGVSNVSFSWESRSIGTLNLSVNGKARFHHEWKFGANHGAKSPRWREQNESPEHQYDMLSPKMFPIPLFRDMVICQESVTLHYIWGVHPTKRDTSWETKKIGRWKQMHHRFDEKGHPIINLQTKEKEIDLWKKFDELVALCKELII